MMRSDSTTLALRAQAGERAAFEQLYDRHVSGVARALASFAGPDRATLEDLVQEVFLRVVERLHTFRAVGSFEQWLFTIALNVGRNHFRDRKRHPTEDIDLLIHEDPRTTSSDQIVDSVDLMRQVARLSLEMREVVALRVGSDLSFAAIAELLDIPPGTARRRMHTAMARLRTERQLPTIKERNDHERSG